MLLPGKTILAQQDTLHSDTMRYKPLRLALLFFNSPNEFDRYFADSVLNWNDSLEMSLEPKITAIKSSIFPGWGQIENGHLWKMPIIYAGFAALGYSFYWNDTSYTHYREAYLNKIDDDPNTVDYYPLVRAQAIGAQRDFHRRNRDLSVIGMATVYLLNIVDAFVYAHLKDFDVSDDLGLRVYPVQFGNIATAKTIGVGLKLNLSP